jgi:hypothetical protein
MYNRGIMGVFFGQLQSTDPLVTESRRPNRNIQLLIFHRFELRWPLVHFGGVGESSLAHSTSLPSAGYVSVPGGGNYLQPSTGQKPRTIGSELRSPVFGTLSFSAPSPLLTREPTLACLHPSTDLLPLLPVQRPISQKSYL